MILKIVQDIRKSLENDLYFAALNSAIILPDICGKAAYPEEKSSRKRYILWYDEEIGKYEKAPDAQGDMPYLSGNVVYNLRCALLHEGNPNLSNDKRETDCQINRFSLVIEKANLFDIYSDSSAKMDWENGSIREYRMNVRRICMILCNVAEAYYKGNKDKFHFNYQIIDQEKVGAYSPPIGMESI